jgi:pimeloyl-ACP methyl ester carboxylesterase
MSTPQPFRLQVSDNAIADLKERLARTRWPDEPPLAPWSTGTSLAYMRELVEYWRTKFDWRAWEAKLNAFPQFTLPIGGIDLHFIHAKGRRPDAMPLLISHGWPGSIVEFHKFIPLLTEHYTVIAPSLPGYAMSFKPGQERFGIDAIADLYAKLMSELGYERFGVQGGDWGAFVASVMGSRYADRVIGIHINLLTVRRDPGIVTNPTAEEKAWLDDLAAFLKDETGYQGIQGTKPQTLAFGLSDSPAGLAAWIVEKFHRWTDHKGNLEEAVSRDELLANVSLYWFTGAIGSSFWPYYARLHGPWPVKSVDVPTGYAEFPREIIRPPRSVAKTMYTDIRRWTKMSRGGHFAALEQPELLAGDVKEFFASLSAEAGKTARTASR